MASWPVQDAKMRFGELVERAPRKCGARSVISNRARPRDDIGPQMPKAFEPSRR